MKKSLAVASCLFVLVIASSMVTSPQAQEKQQRSNTAPKWEYKVELLESDKDGEGEEVAHIEKQLNTLGEQGWELAEVQLRAAIFKRPKR